LKFSRRFPVDRPGNFVISKTGEQNMRTNELEPTDTLPYQPGKTLTYEGIKIKVSKTGRIEANGCCGQNLVSFNRNQRMSTIRCVAVVTAGKIAIYEGNTIGQDMISEEMVREACGLPIGH
jgi:hypothetical protein